MMVVEHPMYGPWTNWWDMPSDRHNRVGTLFFADGHLMEFPESYPINLGF
jgi:prepilin-type processing-associated H-X9-DG protein